jgi:hypothetical protein
VPGAGDDIVGADSSRLVGEQNPCRGAPAQT